MKKTIKKNRVFILLFIIILISNIFNNKIALFIQIGGNLFYLFFILLKEPKKILLYFYILFIMIINLVGIFLIEFFAGKYLYEIKQLSYYKNSLFPISIYTLINFYILSLIKLKDLKLKKSSNKIINNIIFILLILIILIFIKIISKPIFLLNIDKYKYAKEYLNPLVRIIINIYQYYLPLFLGYIYNVSTSGKIKIYINIIIIFLLIILLCIGIKFGGFFHFFYWFSLPFMLSIKSEKKLKKRIFQLSTLVLMLIAVSMLHRIYNYDLEIIEGVNGVINRGFQQGQLWWATYLNNNISYDNFICSEIFNNNEKTRGIYKIMYEILEKNFVDNLYKIKSTYTASTTSTIYLYFGIKGIYIFGIIFNFLFVILYISIIQNLKKGLIINLILLTRIFIILISMFTISKFHISKFIELLLLIISIFIIKNITVYYRRRKYERKNIIYMSSSRKGSELD